MRKVRLPKPTKSELKRETKKELFMDALNFKIERIMNFDKGRDLKVILMNKLLKYKVLETCEHWVLLDIESVYFEVLKIQYYEDGRGFITPNIQIENSERFASRLYEVALDWFNDRAEGKEIPSSNVLRDTNGFI